jgi:hypothetical protein
MRKTILFVCLVLVVGSCTGQTPVENLQPAKDDMTAAQTELVAYFANLANGDYAAAASAMTDNPDFWEMAKANNPEVDPDDQAGLLQAVCQFQTLCMTVHDVVQAEQLAEDEYQFVVRFDAGGGEIFVLGPCCGADETEMPPVSEFAYQVYKSGDSFRVAAEPLYVP